MPVFIKQLKILTKIKKSGGSEQKNSSTLRAMANAMKGGGKSEKEVIIEECLRRVEEMLDYREGR